MDMIGTLLFLALLSIVAIVLLLALALLFTIVMVAGYFISVMMGMVAAILEIPMKRAYIFFMIFVVAALALSLLVTSQILGR